MSLDRINPPDLAAPTGFSHAVVTDRTRTVYLAGQTALDPGGKIVGGTDIVAQFEQALGNFLRALEAAGGSAADLTTVTIYLLDIHDYRTRARDIGAVWRRLAGTDYPAMAVIGVTRLWDLEALVEIQGTAALR